MLGEAQLRLRQREPEGLVALVRCRLRHPQAVLRVVAVDVVGTHVYAPRYAFGRNAISQPGQTRDPPEREWTEKRSPMSDWRHRHEGRSHSTQKKHLAPSAAGIAMPMAPLDCQAGWDVYVRRPCRLPRRPGISWSFTAPTCT